MNIGLTASELADIRSDIADLLPDTCTVLEVVHTQDAIGAAARTYALRSTGQSCRVDPVESVTLSGKEIVSSIKNYIITEGLFVLTMLNTAVIQETDRLLHNGVIYEILHIDDDKSWQGSVRGVMKTIEPSGVGGEGSYLLLDYFTDTNEVDLKAHTPEVDIVGTGWEDDAVDTFDIAANKATYDGGNAGTHLAWVNVGQADVLIKTRFTIGAGDPATAGLALRASADGSDFVRVHVDPEEDDITMVRAAASDSALHTSSPGNVCELTVICSGNEYSAELLNVTTGERDAIAITDSNVSLNTRFGLFTVVGAGPEPSPVWDLIEIYKL